MCKKSGVKKVDSNPCAMKQMEQAMENNGELGA